MVTKVQKWGNSQGLRFSKEILARMHTSIGDDADVNIRHGKIVIRPALVISNTLFNQKTGLAMVCPITTALLH